MTNEHEDPVEPEQGSGRPIFGDEAVESHTISMQPANWRWLGKHAEETGRSRSQVIDRWLTDQRRQSVFVPDITESAHQQALPSATADSFNPPPEPRVLPASKPSTDRPIVNRTKEKYKK